MSHHQVDYRRLGDGRLTGEANLVRIICPRRLASFPNESRTSSRISAETLDGFYSQPNEVRLYSPTAAPF